MNCPFCSRNTVVGQRPYYTCSVCGREFNSAHQKLLKSLRGALTQMRDDALAEMYEALGGELARRNLPSKGVILETGDPYCSVRYCKGVLTVTRHEGGGSEPSERKFAFDAVHFLSDIANVMIRNGYRTPTQELKIVGIGSADERFFRILSGDEILATASKASFVKFVENLGSLPGITASRPS